MFTGLLVDFIEKSFYLFYKLLFAASKFVVQQFVEFFIGSYLLTTDQLHNADKKFKIPATRS